MRTFAAGLVILVLTGTLGQAAPLVPRQVAADAKWLVHIDVDAMFASVVVQRAWKAELSRWRDVEARVAAVRDQMCMDPAKDLHDILAYGSVPGSPEGVLIVHAAVDQVQFVEKVGRAPNYRAGNHREFKWYSWVQADGPVTCGFFRPDVLVLAKTTTQATRALDVLDGKSPGLPADHALAVEATPPGTILTIRAIGLADATLPFKSPVITHCQSLQIAFGEYQAKSFSEVNLWLTSTEAADQVRTVLEGLLATALLQYGTNPGLERLLKNTKVTIAGNKVSAATAAPADEVWTAFEGAWPPTPERQ